jgi:transposase
MRQRTRAKREVHAVLMRTLNGRPPMSDALGRGGRVWLAELELPADERETVDECLRQIDFLDAEIAILERAIA